MSTHGNGSTHEVPVPMTPRTDEEVDALWEPGDAIDEAPRLGVIDAARRHLAAGVHMVIWRDGRIVHVPAAEVLAELGVPVKATGEESLRTGRNGGAIP